MNRIPVLSGLRFGVQNLIRFIFFVLLLFVCAFFGCGGLLLFIHFLAQFFLALGADFSPLDALLVNKLLTTQQLDIDGIGTVSLSPAFMHDAQVTAIAVAETRSHSLKETVHGFTGQKIGTSQATGRKVAALAQRDQLFHVWTHGFGFGWSSLKPLFHDE